jgi:hypothetical protein
MGMGRQNLGRLQIQQRLPEENDFDALVVKKVGHGFGKGSGCLFFFDAFGQGLGVVSCGAHGKGFGFDGAKVRRYQRPLKKRKLMINRVLNCVFYTQSPVGFSWERRSSRGKRTKKAGPLERADRL